MFCPRCEVTSLIERTRAGVAIDTCPECKGLWLDRGELDRLLAKVDDGERNARARGEREDDRDEDPDERAGRGRHGRRRDDDDDDDDDGPRGGRGFFGTLRSIFD
jgi:hypothetical protein